MILKIFLFNLSFKIPLKMKKSLEQQYLDVRTEMQNHFREIEKESKIEMLALKGLVALLFFGLIVLVII